MTAFERLVDEFLEATWERDPVGATRAGVHRYDRQLADRRPAAMEEWGADLRRFQRRFETVDPEDLNSEDRLDRQWALAVVDYALLNHELEPWARSPREVIQDVGTGLHSLLIGDFAPLESRLESVLARLRAVPASLEATKETLQPTAIPPVWIQSTLPDLRSVRTFIADEVPVVAKDIPAFADDVEEACLRAVGALDEFESYLQNALTAADGDFSIGSGRFDRILRRFHMLDMDSAELLAFGQDRVAEYERQIAEVAAEIDPDEDWMDVLEQVKDDHPEPENLRQAYEDETELARRHCLEHDLITFPEGESCELEWTPAFMRSRVPIAQPRVSPAFEEGLDSKWYITPVDPEAPAERQRQHIRDNSWAWIRGIAMHEIYPGHHLQLVVAKVKATPLRLQFWSPVFGEGWGLYTEELFYETGLLTPPRFRLMQLRNGLWRAVRILVDVGLHTQGMSVQEAAEQLSQRARLEPRWAEIEARYYTTRPTYPSSYQVGCARLLQLREAYRAQKGAAFDLKVFHDELMSYGSLPLSMVEKEMLD